MAKLCTGLCDDEVEAADAADRAARSLGHGSSLGAGLALTLPRVLGEGAGMDTPQGRAAGLLLLARLVGPGGCGDAAAASATPACAAALGSEALLRQGWDGEGSGTLHRDLADALLEACRAVVVRGCKPGGGEEGGAEAGDAAQQGYFLSAAAGPAGGGSATSVLRALAALEGCPAEAVGEGLAAAAAGVAASLGVALFRGGRGAEGAEEERRRCVARLYQAHLGPILAALLAPGHHGGGGGGGGGPVQWRNRDPARRAFDAVLRSGAGAVGPHLGTVVPVVVRHVGVDADPDLKLSMLCLLEALLARPEGKDHWPAVTVPLIKEALQHNMVWRAGKVASTVRKVSIACFYALLHQGYADRPVLFQTAPSLLPILKTDLDDYDASTRELVCLCLGRIFRALPGALSAQPVSELYPALLKRLDDSSDHVRFACLDAFEAFWRAAPLACFMGTTLEYSLDQLLVHLDDANPTVQARVMDVLKASVPVDPPKVAQKALAVRNGHRSPAFVDELVALCRAAAPGYSP